MITVRLGDVAEVVRGVTYRSDQALGEARDGYVPILRAGNIQTELVIDRDLVWVPAYLISQEQIIRENDLVMCTSSGSIDLVGKVASSSIDWHGSFGAFCVVVRAKQDHICPRFLKHFLGSVQFKIWAQKSLGANIKNIRKSELESFEFLLPSINEQRRNSAILDMAYDIRYKRREVLKLADEFMRSTFLYMFGDPVTNPMNWDEMPIQNLATVTTGNTPSREVSDYFGDFIEWIKSDNINTAGHYLTKSKEGLSEVGAKVGRSVPAGSTLITCIAGSPSCIGNAALADRTVAFNQQINALTPINDIEPQFLYCCVLFSKKRIQAASTSGMKGMVSKGVLEQVKLICPPKSKREAFVRIFEKIISMQATLQLSHQESEKLFASLSIQSFTYVTKK